MGAGEGHHDGLSLFLSEILLEADKTKYCRAGWAAGPRLLDQIDINVKLLTRFVSKETIIYY